MTGSRHRIRAWLLAGSCCAATATANDIERYEGIAHDHAGRVVYRESHWLRGSAPERELLVLFRCPDGTPFARKHVHEGGRPLAPSFALDDARFGYREGVRAGNGANREVYVRRRAQDAENAAPLEDNPGLVIDAGIDAYIKANWEALVSGQARSMPFVVPSRLRTYTFRVERVGGPARPGDATHRFRLRIDAWYAFAIDSIDMLYDARTRVLREYLGIANVRSDAGSSFAVHMDFPAERAYGVSAAEREAALVVPLDGRCVL